MISSYQTEIVAVSTDYGLEHLECGLSAEEIEFRRNEMADERKDDLGYRALPSTPEVLEDLGYTVVSRYDLGEIEDGIVEHVLSEVDQVRDVGLGLFRLSLEADVQVLCETCGEEIS